jgi:hypothetical protein
VHFGRAADVLRQREQVLRAAYERHPERFVRGACKDSRQERTAVIYDIKKGPRRGATGEIIGKRAFHLREQRESRRHVGF